MTIRIVAVVAAAGMLTACSSRPREFNPVLAAATPDHSQFDADVATCEQLLAAGKLNSSGRLASGAAGAAAGATTAALGSVAATSAGFYGGMAVASATIVAIPFVALGGAYALAKTKQKRKEKVIQTAMSGCLAERGHRVAGWERARKVAAVKQAAASE